MPEKSKLVKLINLPQSLPTSKSNTVSTIAITVWTLWIAILGIQEAFFYLSNHWEIALTMTLGSMVAGGTSFGGGAVAFPVLTKLLHIPPSDAKVFSLAIQSVGMGAASLAICLTGVKVEWRVVTWSTLGGLFGVFFGLGFISQFIPPDIIKTSFTMIAASFAVALFFLNRGMWQRQLLIPSWSFRERRIFLLVGFLGGIVSGLVGNGIDIFTFAVMVLLFRMCEGVATPTSVILMAINALAGFALQVFIFQDFSEVVRGYWLAAIPIVVVGAPLGAMLCSLLSRQTIANILITLIFFEVATSLILIPLRPILIVSSLITLLAFSCLNYWMLRNPANTSP